MVGDTDIQDPDILRPGDAVIICSIAYPTISRQLIQRGISGLLYYEELALCSDKFPVYYSGFESCFEELIAHVTDYRLVYGLLEDEMSRRIMRDILQYRMSLDCNYTRDACALSRGCGECDLDKIVLDELKYGEWHFFDCGGYDGGSTVNFIKNAAGYKKIYFFEPDKEIIRHTEESLAGFQNIEFVQAAVGAVTGKACYDALGGGAGKLVSDHSYTDIIKLVRLDDYSCDGNIYIKMDIEGGESDAIRGAKSLIAQRHPMMSVSVYHKSGDLHHLVRQVLDIYSGYKVYLRHYSDAYDDTRVYFIPH